MKKTITKILAATASVISFILILILVILAFKGLKPEEIQKGLGKGLIIALSITFLALTVIFLALLFSNDDVIKEIIIKSEHKGSVYATMGVIKKTVKKATFEMVGIKCGKVAVFRTEFGVRLMVNVKVTDEDAEIASARVRIALEDRGSLGYTFNSIEVKITSLKSKFMLDKEDVDKKVNAEMKEQRKQAIETAAREKSVEKKAAEMNKLDEQRREEAKAEAVALNDNVVEANAEEVKVTEENK